MLLVYVDSRFTFQVDEPDESFAAECKELLEAFSSAVEPAAAAAGPLSDGSSIEREGLAFLAGYVAFACRHIDPSLGQPTSSAPPEHLAAVPNSWIATISRGQLFVPSPTWRATVEEFDRNFRLLMGPSADRQPRILERLQQLIVLKRPDLDPRIVRKLASSRLHLHIRWLNSTSGLKEAQEKKRAADQVRHHMGSSRGQNRRQ